MSCTVDSLYNPASRRCQVLRPAPIDWLASLRASNNRIFDVCPRIHEMLNTVYTCRLICQRGRVSTVYSELMYAVSVQVKYFLLFADKRKGYQTCGMRVIE